MWRNFSTWQFVIWKIFSTWQIFSPQPPVVMRVTNIRYAIECSYDLIFICFTFRYHNPKIFTPTLDRLSRQTNLVLLLIHLDLTVRFEQSFCQTVRLSFILIKSETCAGKGWLWNSLTCSQCAPPAGEEVFLHADLLLAHKVRTSAFCVINI